MRKRQREKLWRKRISKMEKDEYYGIPHVMRHLAKTLLECNGEVKIPYDGDDEALQSVSFSPKIVGRLEEYLRLSLDDPILCKEIEQYLLMVRLTGKTVESPDHLGESSPDVLDLLMEGELSKVAKAVWGRLAAKYRKADGWRQWSGRETESGASVEVSIWQEAWRPRWSVRWEMSPYPVRESHLVIFAGQGKQGKKRIRLSEAQEAWSVQLSRNFDGAPQDEVVAFFEAGWPVWFPFREAEFGREGRIRELFDPTQRNRIADEITGKMGELIEYFDQAQKALDSADALRSRSPGSP